MTDPADAPPSEWLECPALCPHCYAPLLCRFNPGTTTIDRFTCERCGKFDNDTDQPSIEANPNDQRL